MIIQSMKITEEREIRYKKWAIFVGKQGNRTFGVILITSLLCVC